MNGAVKVLIEIVIWQCPNNIDLMYTAQPP